MDAAPPGRVDGNRALIELLLRKGADIEAKMENGWSPLHLAADDGRKDLVEFLFAKGADIRGECTQGWKGANVNLAFRNGDEHYL